MLILKIFLWIFASLAALLILALAGLGFLMIASIVERVQNERKD